MAGHRSADGCERSGSGPTRAPDVAASVSASSRAAAAGNGRLAGGVGVDVALRVGSSVATMPSLPWRVRRQAGLTQATTVRDVDLGHQSPQRRRQSALKDLARRLHACRVQREHARHVETRPPRFKSLIAPRASAPTSPPRCSGAANSLRGMDGETWTDTSLLVGFGALHSDVLLTFTDDLPPIGFCGSRPGEPGHVTFTLSAGEDRGQRSGSFWSVAQARFGALSQSVDSGRHRVSTSASTERAHPPNDGNADEQTGRRARSSVSGQCGRRGAFGGSDAPRLAPVSGRSRPPGITRSSELARGLHSCCSTEEWGDAGEGAP